MSVSMSEIELKAIEKAEIRLPILARIKEIVEYGYNVHEGSALDTELKKLAHELFPPMAKPLAWRIDGDDICSRHVDFEWYRIRNFPSCAPSDDLLINCALCGIRSANSLQWCMTIDEAKAWCESRHQARILEQLA